jgi:FAD/FMN-containing dehydrogenase
MDKSLITSGVLAQDTTQFHSLWSLRELIPESAGKAGSVYKYDLSVPVPKMYELVEKMRERLEGEGLWRRDGGGRVREVVGYGHVGDGELAAARDNGDGNFPKR